MPKQAVLTTGAVSGVTKRGDAINVADLSNSNFANHHAEVHSILKNRHIKVTPEQPRRSKSVSRREGGVSSSLTRRRSRSRSGSARKLGSKSKSKSRSQSQPPRNRSTNNTEKKSKLLVETDSGLDEDELGLLEKSCKESVPFPSYDYRKNTCDTRCKSERDQNGNDRLSRGRDTGARHQSESVLLPSTRSARGASLSRYSNFLRRGRSASARDRKQQNKSLVRCVSPSRIVHSQQEVMGVSKRHSREEVPYDAIVLRENSFESFQSSLTGDHLEMVKPRSKSLIRSAIRHLGMTSKKRLDQSTRDQDNDNTQVTESTMNTSSKNSNADCAEPSQTQWDPEDTLLKQQGEQLDIIDSDSEEDRSCATRSDQGLNDSCDKLNDEGNDTFQYDPFHSSGHPMFQKTMQCDEESAASPPKDLTSKRLASSIGKVIARGRSLSVGRKKIGVDLESQIEPKQNQSKRSKSIHPKLQKPTKQQSTKKQSKLRSASVDTKTNRSNRGKSKSSSRSISVARMHSKKKGASLNDQKVEFLQSSEKSRKKKVKCIVCRQRLSKGQCVEYLDLYFCPDSDGQVSCFRCAKCQCQLNQLPSEDIRVCNAQVMTNSRGSVVQCGHCCSKTTSETDRTPTKTEEAETEQVPEDKTHPFVAETPPPKTCASCKGDFFSYNGEIQVLGEHTYHSACLKRESLKQSGQSMSGLYSASSSFSAEDSPVEAAQKMSEKLVVKLSILDEHRNQREYLTATFFEWPNKQESIARMRENEQSKRMEKFLKNDDSQLDLSLEIVYELDPSAFGNPNYSGHHFSAVDVNEDHRYSPRKTTVAFPIDLEVDKHGRICTDLTAEMQWIGQPNPSTLEHVSSTVAIEPFPYEDSSACKIMNQMWRYEFNGVYHEFQFSVPFKSKSLSLDISKGDEINLSECRFDVFLDQEQHSLKLKMPEQDPMKFNNTRSTSKLTASVNSMPSSGDNWESRADQLMHEVDNLNDFDLRQLKTNRIVSTSVLPKKSLTRNSSDRICHASNHGKFDPDGDEITNVSELLSVARSGEHHAISLPRVIHIKARKETSDDSTGLSLIESNGSSVVAEVSKSGLFSSRLNEGAVVLAINGCPVRNPKHFMRLFKDADCKVTIMASDEPPVPGSIFTVVRKEKDSLPDIHSLRSNPEDTADTLGISFEMVNDLVRVREVSPYGIFANSSISKGDICLMVDGVAATNLQSAVRALAFARGAISLLTFPLQNLWSNLMDLMISDEYNRNWRGSVCELSHSGHPISIHFDYISGLCFENTTCIEKADVYKMNTIIERVMDMLVQSIKICREPTNQRGSSVHSTTRTRSISVSASGSMKGRSDVYRRALIKLEEMKASGKLSKKDYTDAKHALMNVAIQPN